MAPAITVEGDRVGVGDTIPQKVLESEVTPVALEVFANFVQKIGNIAPTATMKETPQISVRRSSRFIKPVEGVGPAPPPASIDQEVRKFFEKTCSSRLLPGARVQALFHGNRSRSSPLSGPSRRA